MFNLKILTSSFALASALDPEKCDAGVMPKSVNHGQYCSSLALGADGVVGHQPCPHGILCKDLIFDESVCTSLGKQKKSDDDICVLIPVKGDQTASAQYGFDSNPRAIWCPPCLPSNAPAPPSPTQNCTGVNSQFDNSTQTCECKPGYNIQMDGKNCCKPNKIWDEATQACVCSRIQNCTGANQQFDNKTKQCSCKAGYLLQPDKENCCKPNKVWDTVTKTCICSKHPTQNCTGANSHYDNKTNTCVCKSGFTLQPDDKNCCKPSQTWDESKKACICSKHPTQNCTGVNSHYDNKTKTCVCKRGFNLQPDNKNCCKPSQTWDESKKACICSKHPAQNCTGVNSHYDNKTKTCVCKSGFNLQPDNKNCCRPNKVWDNLTKLCICSKHPKQNCTGANTHYDNKTKICVCKSGFNIQPDKTNCCRPSQTWDASQKSCIKRIPQFDTCPLDYHQDQEYNCVPNNCKPNQVWSGTQNKCTDQPDTCDTIIPLSTTSGMEPSNRTRCPRRG